LSSNGKDFNAVASNPLRKQTSYAAYVVNQVIWSPIKAAKGNPVTSKSWLNNLLANSKVSFDTYVFVEDNSTPNLVLTVRYESAT
jgi:hypothetical protein